MTPSPGEEPALPAVLVLTDRHQAAGGGLALPDLVEALADVDDVWLVFREKDLDREERATLGRQVAAVSSAAGLPLLVASDPALANRCDALGVHLAGADPVPASRPAALGRSCHGLHDLLAAEQEGVDYVTLSPVFATDSKPGYGPPLGVGGLRSLLAAATLPAYALGGVVPGRARDCIEVGAYGVAVMGGVMAADDPAEVLTQLVAEVHDGRAGSGA